MRDELRRFGKTVAVWANEDKELDIFIVPCCDGESVSASGRITEGPEYFFKFVRQCVSSGLQ